MTRRLIPEPLDAASVERAERRERAREAAADMLMGMRLAGGALRHSGRLDYTDARIMNRLAQLAELPEPYPNLETR